MGVSLGLNTERRENTLDNRMVGDMSNKPKWGASNPCPACSKNVYPNEQVFAADRKPWHKRCLKCAVMGCSNELFERGFHKTPDGKNICDSCNEIMFEPKSYGPAPGMESLEERRLRAAREAEERERKLKEIEMMRNKKDDFGDTPQVYCMKITETCTIATDKVYSL